MAATRFARNLASWSARRSMPVPNRQTWWAARSVRPPTSIRGSPALRNSDRSRPLRWRSVAESRLRRDAPYYPRRRTPVTGSEAQFSRANRRGDRRPARNRRRRASKASGWRLELDRQKGTGKISAAALSLAIGTRNRYRALPERGAGTRRSITAAPALPKSPHRSRGGTGPYPCRLAHQAHTRLQAGIENCEHDRSERRHQ